LRCTAKLQYQGTSLDRFLVALARSPKPRAYSTQLKTTDAKSARSSSERADLFLHGGLGVCARRLWRPLPTLGTTLGLTAHLSD
jgi:hypothetical protein